MARELIGYVDNRPVHLINDEVITVKGTNITIGNVTRATAYEVAKRSLKDFKSTKEMEG